MKVKLKCGDSITIPKGCKAIIKGESVEIAKAQKFKDGDVLVVVIDDVACPFIFFKTSTEFCCYHIMLRPNGEISRTWFFDISKLVYTRHATEEEKRQLFDKMKEKGWQWNAEEKRVEKIRWRAKGKELYYYVGSNMEVYTFSPSVSEDEEDDFKSYNSSVPEDKPKKLQGAQKNCCGSTTRR